MNGGMIIDKFEVKTVDDKPTGYIATTIVNFKGSVLPSTGGIGTTIFYVIGGILMVGAGVILISRKRMDK